jgi:uncharacterized membrane protein
MTQTEPSTPPLSARPVPPAGKRTPRYLLIGSLALNLLVLGLVGGAILRDGPGGFGGPRGVDLTLGPIVEALAPQDRQAIRADLRAHEALRIRPRQERQAMIAALQRALRADAYDPAAVEAALSMQRDRLAAVQVAGQQALVARINLMSPADRLAFADRLAQAMDRDHDHGDDAPEE